MTLVSIRCALEIRLSQTHSVVDNRTHSVLDNRKKKKKNIMLITVTTITFTKPH